MRFAGLRSWSALAVVSLVAAAALALVALRGPARPRTLDDRVRAVASTLRCPVCQNLSVADSPSRLAQQMRVTIAQELEAGRTPDQIRSEFAGAYGEWVLLAPPRRGVDLIAWLAPLLLVLAGVAAGILAVRRWTAGRGFASAPDGATGARSALGSADRLLLERALQRAAEETE